MNRRTPNALSKLHIWQQNTHKLHYAQQYIINTANSEEWNVIAIQEPWLDKLNNARGSTYWCIIYPSNHLLDDTPHTCSILMINTNIAIDMYTQMTISNNDITAIHFNGEFGHLSLFNIYNDCTHNDSLSSLSIYLSSSHHIAQPTLNNHMIWLGDLNCHHPLWEPETNWHLDFSDVAIQPLLNLLDAYDMDLALPPGIPTYETATHNWTHPDNVWHLHHNSDPIISCNTDPHICPPKANHLPIITVIELPIARTSSPPSHDFHSIDFVEFNTMLKAHLDRESPATLINSKEEFDEKVDSLTSIIQQTIYDLALMNKPCPFSK